ncbi:MAG: transcription-repair coupling factor, partial [Gemmataceae bacterium]|nr:transcription-repair coupling factor [Gemmataceae bacterium]MDW8267366.1 transcription-repair coupling factor [Gemmataceae bacterium]
MPTSPHTFAHLHQLSELPRVLQAAEGFDQVIAALRAGRSGTIDGAWGSSAALAAAALARLAPTTVLVVIAHPRDVDAWTGDLTSFAGLPPLHFPAWDNRLTDTPLHDEVSGQRLRVLQQLASESPPACVLTTIQALIQPVPNRQQLAARRRCLGVGDRLDPDELADWLVSHGFRRVEAVELPGEFSRRGGIFDIFSLEADNPCRLEFFGDEIESLRIFSAPSQRSLETITRVEILAAAGPGP